MMQVAFVNTDQQPKAKKYLGCFDYTQLGDKMQFYELAELTYPHPDAPEDANLTLLEWLPINVRLVSTFKAYIDQGKELSGEKL